MKTQILVLITLVFGGLNSFSQSEDLSKADSLFSGQEYEKAQDIYKSFEGALNPEQLGNYGFCFYMKEQYKEGLKWIKESAVQGDPKGMRYLGFYYERGLGNTIPDSKKAVMMYRMAANKGDDVAQMNLGYHYANGIGVDEDVEQAIYWYAQSAEQGNPRAQNNLGDLYERRASTEKGISEAVE
ncbi:MAG: sel1 repeat family protein [Bacteroidetes bacterium]|nr:sel1 repeat family protein [Bacteroidota bacterium]